MIVDLFVAADDEEAKRMMLDHNLNDGENNDDGELVLYRLEKVEA